MTISIYIELALAGVCVTELPPFLAQEHIAKGQLQHLLKNYPLPLSELNLLYSSRRQLSRLVRTYVNFCSEWIGSFLQSMEL